MLQLFGAQIERVMDGAQPDCLHGPARLRACDMVIPGDPSSAAFDGGSADCAGIDVVLENVMLNKQRDGLVVFCAIWTGD